MSKNNCITAEEWNEKYPVGTSVTYTDALGTSFETVTRSEAWELGSGTPVVSLNGKSGGYALTHITPKAEM